jgi:hypothetical protein
LEFGGFYFGLDSIMSVCNRERKVYV